MALDCTLESSTVLMPGTYHQAWLGLSDSQSFTDICNVGEDPCSRIASGISSLLLPWSVTLKLPGQALVS